MGSKPTLSCEPPDHEAFHEGMIASKQSDGDPGVVSNPYPKGTDKWFSWNRGWNTHYDKKWKEPSFEGLHRQATPEEIAEVESQSGSAEG